VVDIGAIFMESDAVDLDRFGGEDLGLDFGS